MQYACSKTQSSGRVTLVNNREREREGGGEREREMQIKGYSSLCSANTPCDFMRPFLLYMKGRKILQDILVRAAKVTRYNQITYI